MSEISDNKTLSDGEGKSMIARSDSYVRDHLANERTYLAWLRTAISLMGFGVLIARLRWILPQAPIHRGIVNAWELGLLLAGVGLLMIPFALWQYFATMRAINNNSYQALAVGNIVFGVAIALAGVGILIYLISSTSSLVAPISQLP